MGTAVKLGPRQAAWIGVLVILVWLVDGGRAAAESLESFLDRVESSAARVGSFSCDFRQERNLSLFARPVVFSGRLYLARPDRLRWEFTAPIPSLLILDGNIGRRCGEGSQAREFRLDRDPVMRVVAEQLRTWTTGGYRNLQDDFALELEAGPALRMDPRQEGIAAFLSRIVVVFDPDTLQPSRVEIVEVEGDSTVISLTSYRLNPDLPPEIFSECRINP